MSIDLEITARLAAIAERLEYLSGITPSAALRRDETITARLKRIEDSLAAGVLEAHTLTAHLDVDAADADDGQMLKFDEDANEWKNTSDLEAAQIDFDIEADEPLRKEGRLFYDNRLNALTMFPAGDEVTHTLGHEVLGTVYNNNGTDILNGEVVIIDRTGTGPQGSVVHADASTAALATGSVGVATEKIEVGTAGMITILGALRSIDTSSYVVGQQLYLSETAGQMTGTAPESPAYVVKLATVAVVHESEGIIFVHTVELGNEQGITKVFNGACLEPYTNTVTSDGAEITCTITADTGTDLSLIFEEGLSTFVTPASVVLSEGTDAVPVLNYVFIPETTGVLTKSTVGWPATLEFQPVATVFCQSAATAQNDPVLKNHSWNDHLGADESNGHLSDINSWIRNQHATWLTGATPSITDGATSYFAATAGTALQLHVNTFGAVDMAVSDPVYIVNDAVTAYLRSVDLVADIDADSAGGTLVNKYFTLVFLGIVNSDGNSVILCNLPSGSYNSQVSAENDALNYADFSLPADFKGTGFLLGRVVIRLQGGNFTEYGMVDMRGTTIGSSISGGGSSGLFSLEDLTDTTIAAPADLHFLVHDGTDWKNRIMALGDLPSIDITDLNDVVITAAATGEYLRYDGANWVDDGIVLGDLPAIALNDLSNVSGAAPTNALLIFSGGSWRGDVVTFINKIGQHTDVTITTPATGDIMSYTSVGATWQNIPDALFIKADGGNPLTADWDVGNFKITVNQLEVDTDSILTGDVTLAADLKFAGAGSGLHYAEILNIDNGVTITLNTSADVQIDIFDKNGPSNGSTPDYTNHHITVGVDGMYLITCNVMYSNTSLGGQYGNWDIQKNNGAARVGDLHQHFSIPAADTRTALHLSGIVALDAGDTIEVWMGTNVAADRAMRIQTISLSIVQIGGVA